MFTFCHVDSRVDVCRAEPVLPLLTFVQQRGNTTYYEWRTGTAPTVVEKAVVEDAPPETVTEDAVSGGLVQINMVGKQISVLMCSANL